MEPRVTSITVNKNEWPCKPEAQFLLGAIIKTKTSPAIETQPPMVKEI
jgi:hypothetical protein